MCTDADKYFVRAKIKLNFGTQNYTTSSMQHLLVKVHTPQQQCSYCFALNYVAVASIELFHDISPPQPVLADLFELDTTAVHAVVSFHFTTTHQAFFCLCYVVPR